MRQAFTTIGFSLIFGAAFWFCLTDSLDQMTARDCQAGIAKACEALK